MPSWWGKSSSKEVKKKSSKESFIDSLHRKFRTASEEKSSSRSGGSQRHCSDNVSERASRSRVPSRTPSPSKQVARCQSFADRPHSQAQPLPLPGLHMARINHATSGSNGSMKSGINAGTQPFLFLPLPAPGCVPNRLDSTSAEGDLAAASISSDTSTDSDDPSDSRLLSPLTSDYENGNRTAINSPSSGMRKDTVNHKNSREILKPTNLLLNNPNLYTPSKRSIFSNHVQNLQIPHQGAFCSAPDSSMSSPSRSPMRTYADQFMNSGFWVGKPYSDMCAHGSGQCSSAGSGQNSGHNSVGGEMSGQLLWQHSRCSPECSPIPSPRMTSPGPSSRIHSGAVTPLHPRAGGAAPESLTSRPDIGRQQSHRLPLPPIKISNSYPISPTHSTTSTPSVSRSPGRAENPISPGSPWKKGRLLGRGTFGHVYLGFNRQSGEMCAMKEVTLFVDDAKSKESAQQLGQEISLLSRLQHPNIVQYHGSETVDDKLYIYLEYVSGGSIYKLLQDYGQFGEIAIRSYTQQILSGLAYLHAKNTVHRDIKGANILVDPNGRVKLADFGMAKHISGHSCPLSFKGSPYWMAPEVIKNSDGCNLAVDIWSLGCTVLEMATAKPPWSQYEGVAAMFKIGNSKELPETPDHMSDDGKDFVRLCLQRNPLHRPTAAQLLEHPFVQDAAPLERSTFSAAEPSEAPPPVSTAARSSLGIGQGRNLSCLDSEGVAILQSRGSKTGSGSSDHIPINMSCPVSPIGSPLIHSRSPQRMSARMSPSPISSPRTTSGSSTPLTGGSGAIPFHHLKHPVTNLHEGIGMNQRFQNSFYTTGIPCQEPSPDLFQGMSQPSHVFREFISSDNAAHGNKFGPPLYADSMDPYDGQLVLADRVCQKLLQDNVKFNPSMDLNPGSPMLGRTNGFNLHVNPRSD